MVNLFMLVSTIIFSILWNLQCAGSQSSLSSSRRKIHRIQWSSNVSATYPPSDPLRVKLGDVLNIVCPANGTSNVWIQYHLEQYEECNCSAAASTIAENSNECDPTTTVRHVCQDEVILEITQNSEDLNSALSFQQNTTFYLISYSRGNKSLAGYEKWASGGQCAQGFKMAVTVLSNSGPGPNVNINDRDHNTTFMENNRTDIGGLDTENTINGALPWVNLSVEMTFSLSLLCFISLMIVT